MKDEGAEPYPSKRLGQHFLRDQRTIQRIIDALAPNAGETIIEIGPGTGALTSILVERAGRVIGVEFDNKLTPLLTERFSDFPNFKLDGGCADDRFLRRNPSGSFGKTGSEPSVQHLHRHPAKTDRATRMFKRNGVDAST